MKIYESLSEIVNKNNLSDKIITSDIGAWLTYPKYNHIYNKLWLANSQDLECGPMGVYPNDEDYPVIFKPIINLFGMSRGIKKIHNYSEYNNNILDGFFWEEFLEGEHNNIDLVMKKGKIVFYSCLISIPAEKGSFDYHYSNPEYKLPKHLKYWVEYHLKRYTGCVNIEVINGSIIEAHLRFNGDFYLYDEDFVCMLHNLFEHHKTNISSYKIKKKYLIPIFVDKNYDVKRLNKKKVMKLAKKYNAYSIRFNDINSKYQSEYLSRIIMFDIDDLNKGLKLKDRIIKYLYQ